MNEQNNINQPHIDQHIFDLINASIDDELSPGEQGELEGILADSEQARNLSEELRSFTRLLNDVPERTPPEYLHKAIESQIRLPVKGTEKSVKKGFPGSWLSENWLRTGFALAAGVVITVGVYEMGSAPISLEDVTNMTGTVVQNPRVNQQELLDSIQIYTDTLTGIVELRGKGDLFSLDVELKSDGQTQLVVDFAGRGLEFDGIKNNQDSENSVSLIDGSINVVGIGAQSYSLQLRQKPGALTHTPLELEFFANNALVQEGMLGISKK